MVVNGSPLENDKTNKQGSYHHSLHTNLHISTPSFTQELQLNFAAWFENHFNNIYFDFHMLTGKVIASSKPRKYKSIKSSCNKLMLSLKITALVFTLWTLTRNGEFIRQKLCSFSHYIKLIKGTIMLSITFDFQSIFWSIAHSSLQPERTCSDFRLGTRKVLYFPLFFSAGYQYHLNSNQEPSGPYTCIPDSQSRLQSGWRRGSISWASLTATL